MMKAGVLLQDYEIILKRYDSRVLKPHKHHCFELIYVLSGNGTHLINGNKYPYRKGSLFLLTPDDVHGLESFDESSFCIIDFSKLFLLNAYKRSRQDNRLSEIYKKSEFVFHSYNREKGDIQLPENEAGFVCLLIHKLVDEQSKNDYTGILIIENIILLILNVVGAHIHKISTLDYPSKKAGDIMQDITAYVHEHIYEKDLLSIGEIASRFNKSKDYISIYFKKMSGLSLKEYILQYKISLVKTRLLYSNLTISEIAFELGFNDESHLNKTFKKHHYITANQFRQNFLADEAGKNT